MSSEELKHKEEVIEAVAHLVLADYIKAIGEMYNELHRLATASNPDHGLPLYKAENMEVLISTPGGTEMKLSLAEVLAHIDSFKTPVPENEQGPQPTQKILH